MDQLERRDNQKRAQRTGWLTESPWESVRQLELPSRTTHKLTHCSFALALELELKQFQKQQKTPHVGGVMSEL
ncbi:hypothetical protein CSV69_12250 [Sporosarcina sp. P26b]|nr:hypothetical protein CSV69_12250 [Sporosarcina sp. P26b]